MAARPPLREDENEHGPGMERWLLTYADMITLLMALFILLYTMSQVDAKKWRKVAGSVAGQFGYGAGNLAGGGGGSAFSSAAAPGASGFMGSPNFTTRIKIDQKALGRQIRRQGRQRDVKLAVESRGLVISLLSGILFDLESATLKPSALAVLDDIGLILAEIPNSIVIEGHTDEQSAPGRPSPNWSLSTRRAMAVLEYLVKKGFVEEKRLSMAAFAANKPVRSYNPDPDERRRLSRRVDLVILGDTPDRGRFDVLIDGKGEDQAGW